jgi:hypothetical protein
MEIEIKTFLTVSNSVILTVKILAVKIRTVNTWILHIWGVAHLTHFSSEFIAETFYYGATHRKKSKFVGYPMGQYPSIYDILISGQRD